jgi:hypothetical protein
LRNYLDAVGEGFRSLDDWSLLVSIACRHADSLLEVRPQRRPGYVLDNRICWAMALTEIALQAPWAVRPCRFYFSYLDGTCGVERNLGTFAAVLAQHQGQKTAGATDYNAMLAECRIDGPRCASDLFIKDEEGVLLFTDVSRELATVWLQRRGRRFGTYKKRKNAGFSMPARRFGTIAAQLAAQHTAVDRLTRAAKRQRLGQSGGSPSPSCFAGVGREDILRDLRQGVFRRRLK